MFDQPMLRDQNQIDRICFSVHRQLFPVSCFLSPVSCFPIFAFNVTRHTSNVKPFLFSNVSRYTVFQFSGFVFPINRNPISP